jgi:serine/threonine-protein kinase
MNEEEIFHEALARTDPEGRAAYLERACAGDPALRASVEALFRADVGASGFLNQQPTALVAAVEEAQPISEHPGWEDWSKPAEAAKSRKELEERQAKP